MIPSFLVSALGAFVPAAAQQPADWDFVAGAVLSPDPGIPFMTESISSPSVVFDSNHNRFIMVFESRTSTVDARCPQGIWALGAAVSNDGINWTPFATPMLRPNPNSSRFYSCVAAHPTAIYDPTQYGGNGGLLVVFKGEQTNDACPAGGVVPPWGCDQYSGFGRLQIELNGAGNPLRVFVRNQPIMIPTVNEFGYPKLVEDFPNYRMLYQSYPDIYATETTSLLSFPEGTPELEVSEYAASVPWVTDELFNATLLCNDDPVFEYATFVGGRNTNFGGIVEGAWGKAIKQLWSDDFLLEVTPQQSWTGNNEWRHWDISRTTTGEYLVWFDEKDPVTGNNFIRFGATDLSFANNTVMSKICP